MVQHRQGRESGVDAAIEELGKGRLLMLVDRLHNRGHLASAAAKTHTEAVVQMSTYACGVVSVAMREERLEQLEIPPCPPRAGTPQGHSYHMPVDASGHDRPLVHTGRAHTVRALASESTTAEQLVIPGHVFPVRVHDEGVLETAEVPEAAADLAELAGLGAIAAFCDAVDEQGFPADIEAATRLARQLGIVTVSIDDVVAYRRRTEPTVRRIATVALPTPKGSLNLEGFERVRGIASEYTAFMSGEMLAPGATVHVHIQCLAGDALGSTACECSRLLRSARERITEETGGVILYASCGDHGSLRHLDPAADPGDSATIDVSDVSHVLLEIGATSINLSANEPIDPGELAEYGIEVLTCTAPKPNGDATPELAPC